MSGSCPGHARAHQGDAGQGYGPGRHATAEAERYWYHRHGDVVVALHPGESLLKEKIDLLNERGPNFDYGTNTSSFMRSEQATRDCEGYFGVQRVVGMSLADYWTQAVAKVHVAHHRVELTRIDRALPTVNSGQLADSDERRGDRAGQALASVPR